jgi:hypothetical protein
MAIACVTATVHNFDLNQLPPEHEPEMWASSSSGKPERMTQEMYAKFLQLQPEEEEWARNRLQHSSVGKESHLVLVSKLSLIDVQS